MGLEEGGAAPGLSDCVELGEVEGVLGGVQVAVDPEVVGRFVQVLVHRVDV